MEMIKKNLANEDLRKCMMHFLMFPIENLNILIFYNYLNLMSVIYLQVQEMLTNHPLNH
jgi:hypothetical protein